MLNSLTAEAESRCADLKKIILNFLKQNNCNYANLTRSVLSKYPQYYRSEVVAAISSLYSSRKIDLNYNEVLVLN